MPADQPQRLAVPALLLGNVALAFGPWLVRLADVGPVAVGFWRVTIALPFLFAFAHASGQRPHWPSRGVTITIPEFGMTAAVVFTSDVTGLVSYWQKQSRNMGRLAADASRAGVNSTASALTGPKSRRRQLAARAGAMRP